MEKIIEWRHLAQAAYIIIINIVNINNLGSLFERKE